MTIRVETSHDIEDGRVLLIWWHISPGRRATRDDPPEYPEAHFSDARAYSPAPIQIGADLIPRLTGKSWADLAQLAVEQYEQEKSDGEHRV